MREIKLETWVRKKHFELYREFDHPHFNLCANVDVTQFAAWVRDREYSFTISMAFLLALTANSIPEFRIRIQGEKIIEYPRVHPSTTILTGEDLFSFCTIPFSDAFDDFYISAEKQMERVKKHLTLEDEPGQDDLLFMTGIPWVSFTSMLHPTHGHPADSVPRIAWGKIFQDGNREKMPLSVQVHHALMDGIHLGQYFTRTQSHLEESATLLYRG